MEPDAVIARKLEEVRRQLHMVMAGRYDPERVQALQALSSEFDRLAVEWTRRQEQDRRG